MNKLFRFKLILSSLLIVVSVVICFTTIQSFRAKAGSDETTRFEMYIDDSEYFSRQSTLMTLSSIEEPAIKFNSYNVTGTVHINIYEDNIENALKFLIYDKDMAQKKTSVNVNGKKFVASLDQAISQNSSGYSQGNKILLPLKSTGIYLIEAISGKNKHYAYVVRSNFGVVAKEGKSEIIFWAQDFNTHRSLNSGSIRVYNLKDKISLTATGQINAEGIGIIKTSTNNDLAVVDHNGNIAIVTLNLSNFPNYYGVKFFTNPHTINYFIFTDRPIYMPGDTVYFKSILRNDSDAVYSLPNGTITASARMQDEKLQIYNKDLTISQFGTVSGSFVIPKNSKTGFYSLNLVGKTNNKQYWPSVYKYFQVEYYRKPEYTISIETPKTKFYVKEDLLFKIKGNYFSGQPLGNKSIKYTLYRENYYDYDYWQEQDFSNEDYLYYFNYYNPVKQGEVVLDKNGVAEIKFNHSELKDDYNKVYSLEINYKDETQIPVTDRANTLVYASQFGIYFDNTINSSKLGSNVKLGLSLVAYDKKTNVADKKISIKIHRDEWKQDPNDNLKWKEESEDLPEQTISSDKTGHAIVQFIATKKGSYNITASTTDELGNNVSKHFYTWVGDYYSDNNNIQEQNLKIITDKKEYKSGENATINIFSSIADTDILVGIEREWLKEYKVISLKGKEGKASFKIKNEHIPNITFSAVGFENDHLNSDYVRSSISSEAYKLKVNIKTDKQKYGPGDTVRLDISTKDNKNKPLPADVAFWVVDKSLFELADDATGDIFNNFWESRNSYTSMSHSLQGLLSESGAERGGCFTGDTKVLMSNGSEKYIKDIVSGDTILTRLDKESKELVRAKVLTTHKVKVGGYMIINGLLRTTPNHILLINDEWQPAGKIQIGDKLSGKNDEEITVTSIEWQQSAELVYNLQIDKFHTFIANGIWVHNDKDNGGGMRSVFKDAAYWNPNVKTNASGHASLTFILPDNLTTWALVAVADTLDTKVGQTKSEITATKDIFVRPILPNILRAGDQLIVSALVNNFTDKEQEMSVSLVFDSGAVSNQNQKISIKSKDFQQVSWPVSVEKINENASFIFNAQSNDDKKLKDIINIKLPVLEYGFWQNSSFAGVGNQQFPIDIATTSITNKTKIKLSLSLSVLGPLNSAMEYLIGYPYGCMEQTTSKFVPVVLAKQNPEIFRTASKDNDLDAMIKTGIERLENYQHSDGSWSWWQSDQADPYLTTYVFEYLLKAKEANVKFDENIINQSKKYFEEVIDAQNATNTIYRSYALSLYKNNIKKVEISNFKDIDIQSLALAIISNYNNGFVDSAKIGADELIKRATIEQGYVHWKSAKTHDYWASKDVVTALALRALITVGADSNIIRQGIDYLISSREGSYWSNTYGTARAIQMLVDYVKINEIGKTNNFIAKLDENEIGRGVISNSNKIVEINISPSKLKNGHSNVSVEQENSNAILSTLTIDEFNTNPNSKPINNGLDVKREYVNLNGAPNIGIGDIVEISITASSSNGIDGSYYGVIEDHLPAGLIPINERLNNESSETSYWYWFGDKDFTKDGVVMYEYNYDNGLMKHTYKARAINVGTYQVPPAFAAKMYQPRINGYSESQTITIVEKSDLPVVDNKPEVATNTLMSKAKVVSQKETLLGRPFILWTLIVLAIAALALAGIIYWKKNQTTKQDNDGN